MGIMSNISKIMKANERKNAVSRIGMEAVKQGALESSFTSEYSSFSVQLRAVLEKSLVNGDDKSITIEAASIDNAKYLLYTLEDDYFKNYYNIEKGVDGSLTFSVRDDFTDLVGNHETEEEKPLSRYEQQLEKFLDL